LNTRNAYLVLAIAGLVLPYSQFVPWIMVHGLDVPLFLRELFSTRIGGFFGLDVIISAIALTFFVLIEGRRLKMRRCWAPVLGTFVVGVSFGLPLFLYMRHPYAAIPGHPAGQDAA